MTRSPLVGAMLAVAFGALAHAEPAWETPEWGEIASLKSESDKEFVASQLALIREDVFECRSQLSRKTHKLSCTASAAAVVGLNSALHLTLIRLPSGGRCGDYQFYAFTPEDVENNSKEYSGRDLGCGGTLKYGWENVGEQFPTFIVTDLICCEPGSYVDRFRRGKWLSEFIKSE